MLKNELVAEYDLFIVGCHAECRTPGDMTDREYAGMLLKSFGPEATDAVEDDPEYEDVRQLVLEAVKDLPTCAHASCKPKRGFDPEKAKNMLPHKVRNAYPPFVGACSDCGYQVVIYVSAEHEVLSSDLDELDESDDGDAS